MDHVKPRRRYDSSGRQAQARRNQRAILAAAQRQFLQGGYAATTTTIAAIAAEAGVSVESGWSLPRLPLFLADYMIATLLPPAHCPRPGP